MLGNGSISTLSERLPPADRLDRVGDGLPHRSAIEHIRLVFGAGLGYRKLFGLGDSRRATSHDGFVLERSF